MKSHRPRKSMKSHHPRNFPRNFPRKFPQKFPRKFIDGSIEFQFQHGRLDNPTDEPAIDHSGLRSDRIGRDHLGKYIVAPPVPGRDRRHALPRIQQLARRHRLGRSHPLVWKYLPPRRQVNRFENDRVEIARLLHRLGQHDLKPALAGLQDAARKQHPLARPRRGVGGRVKQESHAADAKAVGQEPHLLTIPCKDHRTGRELPLCFGNHMDLTWLQVRFGLQNAVGPVDRNEIDFVRAAKSDGDRLEVLPGASRVANGPGDRPSAPHLRRDRRPNTAGIASHGLPWVGSPRERDVHERKAATSCGNLRRGGIRPSHQHHRTGAGLPLHERPRMVAFKRL